MLLVLTTFLAGIVAVYILSHALLLQTQDSHEPPLIQTSIPFLSPILGMIKHKTLYYVHLRDKHNLPIYTLRLPGTRVYVINAVELIPVLQRQWRAISFTPILAASGPSVMGMSNEASKILHRNMQSDHNYVVGFAPTISLAMGPGPSLDLMNKRAVEVMVAGMREFRQKGPTVINFWDWTRHEILMATTDAIYGPQNPYRDPGIEAAWNVFEPSYMTFALAPFKAFLAPKIFRAREKLANAFLSYLQNDGHELASPFIKEVFSHGRRHGLSLDDIARSEIGHSFAVIGTTAPTTWWLVYQIFSDPVVLADVRRELSALVEESDDGRYSINVAVIRTACPILLSTFKETMRHRAIGTSVRMCLEDHVLDGRYLLKKGSMVIQSQIVHHTAPAVWGEDFATFQHIRFVQAPGRRRPNPVAFRAFGGGHTLCPGRHFSSMEILAFAALMVLQFDIVPVAGKWVEPTWKKTPVVASFQKPDEDIPVELRPRHSDCSWHITFEGSSDQRMRIVSEDMR
ncbi:putative cytochrome p450 oxidoreductase [Rosellinia necatrix]|uniref:Putative cytochrome p450 oxidoreductase n=1 Tax=Rosellinia necatrix TaxID=77044 RepID=A0A1W2TAI8_ROSNE|nr:putative cytochrome p450 oxidoreductase [Rosellinia necatrix]